MECFSALVPLFNYKFYKIEWIKRIYIFNQIFTHRNWIGFYLFGSYKLLMSNTRIWFSFSFSPALARTRIVYMQASEFILFQEVIRNLDLTKEYHRSLSFSFSVSIHTHAGAFLHLWIRCIAHSNVIENSEKCLCHKRFEDEKTGKRRTNKSGIALQYLKRTTFYHAPNINVSQLNKGLCPLYPWSS